jgi:hypothetical protein
MLAPVILATALILTPHHAPAAQPDLAKVPNKWQDSGARAVWHGKPKWIRDLGLCIRNHESIEAGHYRAENPTSTAAGAYQFLQSTWTGNAKHTPLAKPWAYKPASAAPPYAQDAVFIHSIEHGGIRAWRGTGCPGT